MRIRFAAVAALVASAAFITTEFASADQYFFRTRGTISATSPGGGSNGPGDEGSLPPGGTPQNDPLIAQGTPPADSYVGQDVAYDFTASGGTAPYTWTLSGSLPPGLTLTSDGTLYGTPSAQAAEQTYSFNVTVTDAVNQQHSIGPFSLAVKSIPDARYGEITYLSYIGTEITGYCDGISFIGPLDKDNWVTATEGDKFETHFASPVRLSWYAPNAYTNETRILKLLNLQVRIEVFNGSNWTIAYEGVGYSPATSRKFPIFPEIIGTKVRLTVTDGEIRGTMPCAVIR